MLIYKRAKGSLAERAWSSGLWAHHQHAGTALSPQPPDSCSLTMAVLNIVPEPVSFCAIPHPFGDT